MISGILAVSFLQCYLSSLRFAGIPFMHTSLKVPAQYFNAVDAKTPPGPLQYLSHAAVIRQTLAVKEMA